MNKISVAIIDLIGLTYDGDTVYKRGLGGSESAVIYMGEELAKLGFEVTVFNNTTDKESKEGIYRGVRYLDLRRLKENKNYSFDIMIGSRSVMAFLRPEHWNQFTFGDLSGDLFSEIKKNAKLKIVWLHDTFCSGDHLLESMLLNGDIDEIFTLSDFHTSYITNCDHGARRNFEVLKNKIFITRNGIRRHIQEVDLTQKDPDLFVYNASVSKGMIPLLNGIWQGVKEKIPSAKLKIVGGFYRFREELGPDEQEMKFRVLAERQDLKNLDVEFLGIIPQKEIAHVYAKASFFIYPGAFPETFGISAMESLTYNTPLITTRFGALEETAMDIASYFINYAIEPNSLFPQINTDYQKALFVELVTFAHANKYLLQQKQNYCNIIHDISDWSNVALQWKQHFYKRLGQFLPVQDYRKVSYINDKVHRIFNRRFSNPEEWGSYKRGKEQRIVVVSTLFNAQDYISRCIESVASQDYDNWVHIIIDDASTDNTQDVAMKTLQGLPDHIQTKYQYILNTNNIGAVKNQITNIRNLDKDDIIILLDGDDWLVNNPNIFNFYNNMYDGTTEFTYGSCWSIADNIPLVAQPYPEHIKKAKAYRSHHFNWILPYTHLRTFKKHLLDNVKDSEFQDQTGKWFRAGGDGAVFYSLIEQADPDKVKVVQDIVYNYNDASPLNDYKINGEEQNKNAHYIVKNSVASSRQAPVSEPIMKLPETKSVKNILIAIPTARNIEADTFKSIYDLQVPEGYKTQFQYFYGYNVEQVRNLIADWVVRGPFDYLFAVDADIAFPSDTLAKMLSHDKDYVSGVYIQRKPGVIIPEIYQETANGGTSNVAWESLRGRGLVEIAGSGFGCVLVKKKVFVDIGYPQFVYKTALNHENTVSEDTYFCLKARERGYKLFADTSIVCDHIGTTKFVPPNLSTPIPMQSKEEAIHPTLNHIRSYDTMPEKHMDYLRKMAMVDKIQPKVVYDIGACVLTWTKCARQVWPTAQYFAFEAMEESRPIFDQEGVPYHIGVLSDKDNKEVLFYQSCESPGGNSYYRENPEHSKMADVLYNENSAIKKITYTLDTVVKQTGIPIPDLIKMDVQGSELDVLKGAKDVLPKVKHLILELQVIDYNMAAPKKDEVIEYLKTQGFELTSLFCDNGADGDYHFVNTKL